MAQLVVAAIWTGLMAAALLVPVLLHSSNSGDDQLRLAIRVSLLFYFAACTVMLRMSHESWRAVGGDVRLARLLWSLAWVAYAIHVLLAFHHAHGWSHAAAIAHTREASGLGEGIYVTHCFTALWLADIAYWWLRPERYVKRPSWIGWSLHGFMAFMVFNGTVVYESGPIRWLGAAMFSVLTLFALRSMVSGSTEPMDPNRLPT